MNTGAIKPSALMQNGGNASVRPAEHGDAFAAALVGAFSSFHGSSDGRTSGKGIFAPIGTNGTRDRRVFEAGQERTPRPSGKERGSPLRDEDAAPESHDAQGLIGLVSPEAAAAALLVSPSKRSELSEAAPLSSLTEHSSKGPAHGTARDAARVQVDQLASERGSKEGGAEKPSSGSDSRPALSAAPTDSQRVSGAGVTTTVSPGNGSQSATDRESMPARATVAGVNQAATSAATTQFAPAPSAGRAAEAVGSVRVTGHAGGLLSNANRTSFHKSEGVPTGQLITTPRRAQAEHSGISAQVARGLASALRQRSGTMTLRLSPESLGLVRIELSVQGKSVRAMVVTASEEAREHLSRDAETLRTALESRGLKVDDLQVVSRDPAAAARALETPTEPAKDASAWLGFNDSSRQSPQGPPGEVSSRPTPSHGRFDDPDDGRLAVGPPHQPVHWDGAVLRLDAIA